MADKLTPEALEYFRKQGARGGRIGSKARMEKLTAEERSDIARKGGLNRWKGRNGKATAQSPPTPEPKSPTQKQKGKKANA